MSEGRDGFPGGTAAGKILDQRNALQNPGQPQRNACGDALQVATGADALKGGNCGMI